MEELKSKELWEEFAGQYSAFMRDLEKLTEKYNVISCIERSFGHPTYTTFALRYLDLVIGKVKFDIPQKIILSLFETALTGNVTNIELARLVLSKLQRNTVEELLGLESHVVIEAIAIEGEEWVYLRLLELYERVRLRKFALQVVELLKKLDDEDIRNLANDYCNL